MHLVHVIPISRRLPHTFGVAGGELTYFSLAAMPKGSLVQVPIRGVPTPALVTSLEEVGDAKLSVKRSDFRMRRLPRQEAVPLLSAAFVEAAQDVAEEYMAPLGSVLYALTATELVRRKNFPALTESPQTSPNTKNAKVVFQAPASERIAAYRSLIREEFARGSSLFILVPTIADGEWLYEELSRGILPHAWFFHGSLGKKELFTRFDAAITDPHPTLIIGTPTFLFLPRHDVHTIIVERESSSSYHGFSRPFLSYTKAAETLSEYLHARLVRADFPLSIETLWRFRNQELDELSPLKLRSDAKGVSVIDMRRPKEEKRGEGQTQKHGFEILSEPLQQLILKGEPLFLFSARRGLAPLTVCEDCQSAVTCDVCSSPVVLHSGGKAFGENTFVCHRCREARSAKERCRTCNSWKLHSLGIGIERVESELKKIAPDRPLLRLDRDHVSTHRAAKVVTERFYESDDAILLGTELAMHYLHRPLKGSAIVSLDSLLSVPEWRISEKVFSLIVSLRHLTAGTFLLQTRHPENPIVQSAATGNIPNFYTNELKLREEFRYPPAVLLIKISCALQKSKAEVLFEKLQTSLSAYELELYEIRNKKGAAVLSGLLRIPSPAWPDKKLMGILRALPRECSVHLNPENIFSGP